MFATFQFAGREWYIFDEEKDKLYLRTVESIGELQWDSKVGRNWSECDLRSYLNGEFYESLPEEDRKRIIPVRNLTNTRKRGEHEETIDKVWLNEVSDAYYGDRTWLRDPYTGNLYIAWCVYTNGGVHVHYTPYNAYNRYRTCPGVCIQK